MARFPADSAGGIQDGEIEVAFVKFDRDFTDDFCGELIKTLELKPDTEIKASRDVLIRKRGDYIFLFNFTEEEQTVSLDKAYLDVLNETELTGEITLSVCGYLVLK